MWMYSVNKSFGTDSTWSTVGMMQKGLRMSVDKAETLCFGNERGIKHQTGTVEGKEIKQGNHF